MGSESDEDVSHLRAWTFAGVPELVLLNETLGRHNNCDKCGRLAPIGQPCTLLCDLLESGAETFPEHPPSGLADSIPRERHINFMHEGSRLGRVPARLQIREDLSVIFVERHLHFAHRFVIWSGLRRTFHPRGNGQAYCPEVSQLVSPLPATGDGSGVRVFPASLLGAQALAR